MCHCASALAEEPRARLTAARKVESVIFFWNITSLFHILGKGYAPFARNYKTRMLILQKFSINQFQTAKFIRQCL